MKLPMDLPQPIPRHVRVNLRRADIRVPEQFLDHSQIGAVLEQVRRETVPQHVRRDVAVDARTRHAILDA